MVFPGVLRGRPGPRLATIQTNRPRRSLSSPWMFLLECSAVSRPKRAQVQTEDTALQAGTLRGALNEIDAVPGRLRNLPPIRPKASR